MNLKELIKEVERLKKYEIKLGKNYSNRPLHNSNAIRRIRHKLQGIKQTIEAVDNDTDVLGKISGKKGECYMVNLKESKDWQKLKKLLNSK